VEKGGSRAKDFSTHLVVGLVKKDVLAIPRGLGRKLLQDAVVANAVLQQQALPELRADLVAALAHLQRHDFARHRWRVVFFDRYFLSFSVSLRARR
jgi:hypothetical protein